MANDPDGFLWVGTRNGLARFDGQRFVPFSQLQPLSQLPADNVLALVADTKGYLWVKFAKQLFRLSYATLKVEAMKENAMPQCQDDKGRQYFIDKGTLAVFRENERDFQQIPLQWEGKTVEIQMVCAGKNGLLFLLTDMGVFRFDPQKNTLLPSLAIGSSRGILVMATDENGMLWLSRWNSPENGIIHYDPYADSVLRTFSKSKDGFSDTDVNGITPDGNNVWFATNSGGLCRYVTSENRVYSYAAAPEKPGHLWNKQIGRCHIDLYGHLWVSSPFFLYKCSAQFASTTLLKHEPLLANSLIAPQCTNIASLDDGQMVFGTLAGLSLYDRKTNHFKNINLPYYGNEYNNQITALAKAENGGFWASSWTGLFRLEAQNGRVSSYFITNNNAKIEHPESVKRLNVGAIRRMCKDRYGVLWVANFGNGIARLDEKSPKPDIQPLPTLIADSLPLNDRAEAFLDWNERYFLIGSLDGLVRFDRSTQRFDICPVVFQDITSPVKIESLAAAPNGDILCIANGKPFRVTWTEKEARVRPIKMPNHVIQAHHILSDILGKIWITTENGLVWHDPQTGNSLFYDGHHYLNDNLLLIRPTVIPSQDPDGKLYFGGSRGVSILRPQDFIVRQQQAPPVKIIDLSINGQRAELDSATHRLQSIRLPYHQNNLVFSFAALNSTIPQRNCFAYRLNGGEWVDLGTDNTLNFSSLAPGEYLLQVKAANSDGVWNEEGTQLKITIRPPWWRSWIAYLCYATLLAYALFRYFKYRENKMQMAYQLAAERKEAERLQALDQFKNRFFANISHEFRTPLTVILGMTEQFVADPGSEGLTQSQPLAPPPSQPLATPSGTPPNPPLAINSAMKMIRRNGENLLRLINQILDLAKMEEGKLMLQPERADMVAFCRYVVESLHSLSEMKGVSLHFEAEVDDMWMDVDLEKMQSVLFNLLSNALKFTPKGGSIYLKINPLEKEGRLFCHISVRDTGIGIPKDKIGRIFDRFYRVERSAEDPSATTDDGQWVNSQGGTGIGLAYTRELVRLMGGEIGVESREGQGSTFELWVPVQQNSIAIAENAAPVRFPDPVWSTGRVEVIAHSPREQNDTLPTLLIVEDNEDVRQYLVACTEDRYRVLQAQNGQEGIVMALEHTPDLIVSDVMMPEKDGFELCQTLKTDTRSSHIPIVLLTAKASVESRIAGLSRGADAYLAKPFHREELSWTLNNLVRARELLQAHLRSVLLTENNAAPAASLPQSVQAAVEAEDAFVKKLRLYVEENMGNTDLSMEELSRAMTMSYQNLHRKLTALTQLSPVQFIRTIRLQKALSLLQSTQLPIGDIAFEVGFSDPKYFSRVFTEEFGKPPSAVRV